MRPTLALAALDAATSPHQGGHRCLDGQWYNDRAGTRTPCAARKHLDTAREQVEKLHTQVHEAAHDTEAATAVAEGMTGLVMADLSDDDREGWVLTARMAIEALAEHLDRDPAREARAKAIRDRLAAAGLDRGAEHFHGCPTPTGPPFGCDYCQERGRAMAGD